MKKSRLAFLLCLLMICATMLSACGAGGAKWGKVLDGTQYEAATVAAEATKIAALSGLEYEDDEGVLVYFLSETTAANEGDPTYEIHTVYNLATDKTVFTATESKTVEVEIDLDEHQDVSFFTVETTTYALQDEEVDFEDYTVKTVLYDAAGTEKASADEAVSVGKGYPFINFKATYFTISEADGIVKAFEKSPFSDVPNVYPISKDYYMGNKGDYIIFYDKSMKTVSSLILPSYAEEMGYGLVGEGKALVQYRVPVDILSDKYDLLEGMAKYDLYTVIFDIAKGKSKEIKCDYAINFIGAFDADMRKAYGLSEKVKAFGTVCPIVDKKVDDSISYLATFTEKGKISVLDKLNGFAVTGLELIGTNLWKVTTVEDKAYLVNEKFEVIGDITNVEKRNAKYLIVDGKVYDYALNMVLDYEAKDLEIYTVPEVPTPITRGFLDTSIIFTDEDGAYHLFVNGTLTKLTETKMEEEVEVPVKIFMDLANGFYAIGDLTDEENPVCKVYNGEGKELLSFNVDAEQYFDIDCVCTFENGILLIVEGYDAENEKETIDYYVVK